MLIYLLVFAFFLLLISIYISLERDITAPGVIYVLGYFISSFVTACNVDKWKIELHWETFFIMLYGAILFCISSLIVQKYYQKKYKGNSISITIRAIEYRQLSIKLFCLLQFIFIMVWVWYLRQFFISVGQIDNLSQAMVTFRNWSSYSTAPNDNALYMFLSRLAGNIIISAYVLSTIIVYNYVIKGNLKNEIFSIFSVFLTVIIMLLQGGRGGIVWLCLNIIMLYFLFGYKIHGKQQNIDLMFILKASIILIGGTIIFYLLKIVVGRGGINLNVSAILDYLSFYIGGQTQLMDMFIVKPIEQSAIWGKETFSILNGELIKLGILDAEPYIWHLEFRFAENGSFLGNSYPSYRSYLYDFGYLGLTILPIIFSLIINILYYQYYYKNNCEISLELLFYVSIFYSIFFDFSRSVFFSSYVSLLSIRIIFMLAVYFTVFIKNQKLSI